jgi:hypothetical protein
MFKGERTTGGEPQFRISGNRKVNNGAPGGITDKIGTEYSKTTSSSHGGVVCE